MQTIGAHVEQGIRLPRKPGWERKAAAHAQLYLLLADAADDPVVASVLRMGAVLVRDLAVTAGPGTDRMITSAHRRLLAHIRAADADAAEHETDSYLRGLYDKSHLAAAPTRIRLPVWCPDRGGEDTTSARTSRHSESLGPDT